MPHHSLEALTAALSQYGYWALIAVLLLENAGLPLPGETILLLASFLASSGLHFKNSNLVLVDIG
jgi:membrane protein DedA with SNARE-associated domain